eukprot:CAMPEP_0172725164 /NCGR_PEP_ID=MMETSP1074-20121228/87730_1 /TAXON_ID=2916 /ORGANISM="Ceratium fusus, Strain PA161109" /LENGTH=234 /DNA_ID=CAMNT_0013551869 /DNA_START=80 /DNA_END=784 /DNA_ORIENTATION=+
MRLAVALVAVDLATALKVEVLPKTVLEKEFVDLHVKLHSTVAGLREQFKNNNKGETSKPELSPMILQFQRGLQRILSDTVRMEDKGAALAELRSADGSVNKLINSYKTWQAANRSHKFKPDSAILLEADKAASSLEKQLSKMEKSFQVKKHNHEQRAKTLGMFVSASATKSNKDALEREDKSFNKLSKERSTQFAKIRSAVEAVRQRDSKFLFSFVRTVHDATVDDDCHAAAAQ